MDASWFCAAEWLCESRWLSEVLGPDWVWRGSRIDLSAQAHGRWLLNSGGRDPSSTLFCTAHDHRHASHCVAPLGSLVITGRPDRVNLVFEEEIKPLLPVEEAFPLSKEFHRSLLSTPNTERERSTRFTTSQLSRVNQYSQNKESVNESSSSEPISKAAELRQKYGISVLVPSQNADSKQIILRGTPSQLEAAKTELVEWVKQCEALKADRIARSFERTLTVPTRFIQDLLTARPKLVESHGVSVRFGADVLTDEITSDSKDLADTTSGNDIGARASDGSAVECNSAGKSHTERMCTVIVRGYQDKVSDALKDLETIVARLQSNTTESVYIPAEVHPHLIGSGRSAISKVMADYNVRITFPNRNNRQITDPNTVYVTGAENDVDKACDYLVAKANDILYRLDSENRTSRGKQYREEILPTPANG
ncbi:unnamed protein product [Dicrocoelium dendriticum]|nr:unnamed protein product [Dicrocoelium dendriticum]